MTDDIWLRALLRNAKDIAILGAKDKPGQPVDGVGRYLLGQGYKIWAGTSRARHGLGACGLPGLGNLAQARRYY